MHLLKVRSDRIYGFCRIDACLIDRADHLSLGQFEIRDRNDILLSREALFLLNNLMFISILVVCSGA